MVTPVGFEVKLFASEKSWQGKPVFMTWDERGRLWTCETVDYPNELKSPGAGRDRIRISEDTDGDQIADKFTIFAENLSIPTAIAFYRGGAVVQDGTETLYLKDTDGDDQADLRKVLVKGWALGDTHGGVSNFQYGLDNWYYGMQGYNNSQPELTDGRKVTPFRMGFFRFKVEGDGEQTAVTEIEFLRSTNNNTWGLGISEEGLIFGSTANGNPANSCRSPIATMKRFAAGHPAFWGELPTVISLNHWIPISFARWIITGDSLPRRDTHSIPPGIIRKNIGIEPHS
jgi:putative membrane-bound dehydrogenase-like protein